MWTPEEHVGSGRTWVNGAETITGNRKFHVSCKEGPQEDEGKTIASREKSWTVGKHLDAFSPSTIIHTAVFRRQMPNSRPVSDVQHVPQIYRPNNRKTLPGQRG